MTDHPQAACEGINRITGASFKFECDKKLVPLLKELNEAGIITLYSCQGNPKDPIDVPYLMIKNLGTEVRYKGKKFYYLFTAIDIIKRHWKNKHIGSYFHIYTGNIIFRCCKTRKQLRMVSDDNWNSDYKRVWKNKHQLEGDQNE